MPKLLFKSVSILLVLVLFAEQGFSQLPSNLPERAASSAVLQAAIHQQAIVPAVLRVHRVISPGTFHPIRVTILMAGLLLASAFAQSSFLSSPTLAERQLNADRDFVINELTSEEWEDHQSAVRKLGMIHSPAIWDRSLTSVAIDYLLREDVDASLQNQIESFLIADQPSAQVILGQLASLSVRMPKMELERRRARLENLLGRLDPEKLEVWRTNGGRLLDESIRLAGNRQTWLIRALIAFATLITSLIMGLVWKDRRARQKSLVVLPPPSPEEERMKQIVDWIGEPSGRGQIIPQAPLPDFQSVHTFEVDGRLGEREIRILKPLGAGLAGTVYLVEDDRGRQFVEKHYQSPAPSGTKGAGRWAAEAVFALWRQAPLSYRELPEAAIAAHLSNRFIVALSTKILGRSFTPEILYTRYDPVTGGYVHAFPLMKGRPLRPFQEGLPLLGEAKIYWNQMRAWRKFIADIGFWGLARQVDWQNPNSFTNVWIYDEGEPLAGEPFLLDCVPGVPGFMEPRYIVHGLLRGEFPPFGDAISFKKLARAVDHLDAQDPLRADVDFLQYAVQRWQDSEPRVWSILGIPLFRLGQILWMPRIRLALRLALVTHLEVKGAISAEKATLYRQRDANGKLPKIPKAWRHMLLKMAPLPIHLALTNGAYAWQLVLNFPRGMWGLLQTLLQTAKNSFWAVVHWGQWSWRMFWDSQARFQFIQEWVERRIQEEENARRLSPEEADRLRQSVASEEVETADLLNLFALHMLLEIVAKVIVYTVLITMGFTTFDWIGLLFGFSSSFMIVAGVAGNRVDLILLGFVDSLVRWVANRWFLWRHPKFGGKSQLRTALIPSVGIIAAPLAMLKTESHLAAFMIRSIVQRVVLRIPAVGERSSGVEIAAFAGVQVCVVDTAKWLPGILVTGALGNMALRYLHMPGLIAWAAASLVYTGVVARATWLRWDGPPIAASRPVLIAA